MDNGRPLAGDQHLALFRAYFESLPEPRGTWEQCLFRIIAVATLGQFRWLDNARTSFVTYYWSGPGTVHVADLFAQRPGLGYKAIRELATLSGAREITGLRAGRMRVVHGRHFKRVLKRDVDTEAKPGERRAVSV